MSKDEDIEEHFNLKIIHFEVGEFYIDTTQQGNVFW